MKIEKKFSMYVEANALLDNIFKRTYTMWNVLIIPVVAAPLILAFFEFIMGKYSEDSWILSYDTFL